MQQEKTLSGGRSLRFVFYILLGLGLEIVLAFGIEPLLYGAPIEYWQTGQYILHWILTCLLWAGVLYGVYRLARQKYGLDLFGSRPPMSRAQKLAVGLALLLSIGITYLDWGGFKAVLEFQRLGLLKFLFQYLYYAVETAMFLFIIVFGQIAFETWFKNPRVPWGGIAVALTWGLGHWMTQGSFKSGLLAAVGGFLYGAVYLLTNRELKKSWLFLYLMFVL